MPRRRIPTERAAITGAARINPGRFAGRANPRTGELGDPPVWLSPGQAEAWGVIRAQFPWLQQSDRILVGIASIILSKIMAGEDVGMTALNQLRLCVAQMGGSPADLAKVVVVKEREADPTDFYFS
jgi:hypothetical protein